LAVPLSVIQLKYHAFFVAESEENVQKNKMESRNHIKTGDAEKPYE
jgi:hypothetical protein